MNGPFGWHATKCCGAEFLGKRFANGVKNAMKVGAASAWGLPTSTKAMRSPVCLGLMLEAYGVACVSLLLEAVLTDTKVPFTDCLAETWRLLKQSVEHGMIIYMLATTHYYSLD